MMFCAALPNMIGAEMRKICRYEVRKIIVGLPSGLQDTIGILILTSSDPTAHLGLLAKSS